MIPSALPSALEETMWVFFQNLITVEQFYLPDKAQVLSSAKAFLCRPSGAALCHQDALLHFVMS